MKCQETFESPREILKIFEPRCGGGGGNSITMHFHSHSMNFFFPELKHNSMFKSRVLSLPRVAFSRVGWFSRALAFSTLYYLWGKMGDYSQSIWTVFLRHIISPCQQLPSIFRFTFTWLFARFSGIKGRSVSIYTANPIAKWIKLVIYKLLHQELMLKR